MSDGSKKAKGIIGTRLLYPIIHQHGRCHAMSQFPSLLGVAFFIANSRCVSDNDAALDNVTSVLVVEESQVSSSLWI
jgi:hypothetical protein